MIKAITSPESKKNYSVFIVILICFRTSTAKDCCQNEGQRLFICKPEQGVDQKNIVDVVP